MRLNLAFCAVFLPGAAVAEGWQPLSGPEISEALTGQSVAYEAARQSFFASGRTLYVTVEDSWGSWRVEGDAYCSQWPPQDDWDCYQVLLSADGREVRFSDAFGNNFDGVFDK